MVFYLRQNQIIKAAMAGRTQSNFEAPFGIFGVSGILIFGIAYSVCHTARQSQRKMEKLQTTGAN